MKPLEHNTLLQNRYLVGQMIGKGGMGEVYLAVDQRVGAPVALKRTYFAGDDVLGGGFESEAKALERLRHQALAKVTDHFFENGDQFLVMDHVAGDDLAKRLAATQKPFPLSWVMFWADQLLDALVYMHSNEPSIVHRDIKPQNLKLTEENNIVLLDFGLSRRSIAKLEGGGIVESGFAKPFAPLEQIRGAETNRRSDIYSLSATLYFLLTNVVPPDATMRADSVLSGVPDPLVPINFLNPEVPASISEVILKGMAVSHDQRFADTRTMQKSLREAFAAMRDTSGAKTVVMSTAPDVAPAEMPAPAVVETVSEPQPAATNEDMAAQTIPFGMLAADLEPEPAAASPEPAPNFDATVRYDGPIVGAPAVPDSVPAQANIKTEVFIKSDYAPEAISPAPDEAPAPPVQETRMPDSTVPFVSFEGESSPAPDLQGFAAESPGVPPVPEMISQSFEPETPSFPPTPDATMAIVNFAGEVAPPSVPGFTDSTNFSVPASPFGDGGISETVAAGAYSQGAPQPVSSAPAAVAAAPDKKRSKGFLIGILVALFLLMIVGAGGVGLAWYVYSGKGSLFGPSETPTPVATPTPVTTPEPTVTPAESDSDLNSPTPTEAPTVTPTETPTMTPTETPGEVQPDRQPTRQTQIPPTPRPTRNVVQPTQKPTAKPTVKPAPKPTLRGREIPQ